MPKLSDSQLVVLTAACQRDDGCAFPVTSKLKGNAAGNVLKSLLAKGLLEEVKASRDDTVWRHDEALGSLTLRATAAACKALGIETDADEAAPDAPQAATRPKKAAQAASGPARSRKGNVRPERGPRRAGENKAPLKGTRTGTKQEKLIALLKAKDGATVDEVVSAFGWQPHTVRGALYGALKKKLGLNITSEKVEGRGRVYRIVG